MLSIFSFITGVCGTYLLCLAGAARRFKRPNDVKFFFLTGLGMLAGAWLLAGSAGTLVPLAAGGLLGLLAGVIALHIGRKRGGRG